MNYQELVDKCKQAYNDKNIYLAYKYWEMIHNLLTSKLDLCRNEKGKVETYHEYHNYMAQFTDNEVYDITDYGKEQANREIRLEFATNGYESVNIIDLDKDIDLKPLENFCDFYEWHPMKSKSGYNILDVQLDKMVEDEDYKTSQELIRRIIGRAIDYFRDEHEWDEEDNETMKQEGMSLYVIACKYNNNTKWDKEWLKDFKEELDEL